MGQYTSTYVVAAKAAIEHKQSPNEIVSLIER